ncbi:MAG: M28 family peptidase [Bacteroidetes bacterium]|jgi:hypothetical protein|nr:M28 family peptidase [Bacteroidota bacterium]
MKVFSFQYLSILLLSTFIIVDSHSQNDKNQTVLDAAKDIDSFELKRHLFFLASDYMQGRETGTWGNNKAANYAAHYFEKWGLKSIDSSGNYYQPVSFTRFTDLTAHLEVKGEILEPLQDFVVSPFRQQSIDSFSASEIHFAGYGISSSTYDDFGNHNWKDKVVLIFKTLPAELEKELSDEVKDFPTRLRNCKKEGVKAVLIVDEGLRRYSARISRYLDAQFLQLGRIDPGKLPLPPNAHVSVDLGERWLGESKPSFSKYRKKLLQNGGVSDKVLRISHTISGGWKPTLEFVQSQNVLGYLPGQDTSLRDEHIVVSAHYDHLGTRDNATYNGADDNGSGTTSVLTLAESFSRWVKEGGTLKRGILFILMTGEEKGLLGSRYYSENPLLSLEKAMANVNIDMVGRIDEVYEDKEDYIYVIGADRISQDLHDLNEKANAEGPELTLDYTYNEEDDPNRYYYRSDHYNFAKKGIPAIFFFNGTHEDYHGVGDTPDKINFSAMQKRIQLIFMTSMKLAQREEPLEINAN